MNTNVRQAERVIDESGVVALIEDCIAKIAGGPGRPRKIGVTRHAEVFTSLASANARPAA